MTEKQINDGGFAFPSNGTMGELISEGMMLRDYFAAKAMQTLCDRWGNDCPISDITALARFAYSAADAMIAERNKS